MWRADFYGLCSSLQCTATRCGPFRSTPFTVCIREVQPRSLNSLPLTRQGRSTLNAMQVHRPASRLSLPLSIWIAVRGAYLFHRNGTLAFELSTLTQEQARSSSPRTEIVCRLSIKCLTAKRTCAPRQDLVLGPILTMISRSILSALSLVVVTTEAAIGPVAQLTVSNAQLAPDGYMREYVVASSHRSS